ncbi:COG4223 family protein [Devosia sp. CAU 1758]
MAEQTGKDIPATDPKSPDAPSGKTGPVRPPVLEGAARPAASSAKPAEQAGTDKPAATRPDKPATTPSPPRPHADDPEGGGGRAWLAGILGGAIGLGTAYGLAWFGLWPTPAQAPAPADPRLSQFATAIPELETVTGTVQDELSTLTSRVGELENALAAAAPAGADPALAESLAALSARVDELSATSSDGSDTEATAGVLAAIQVTLDNLEAETTDTSARLAQVQQQIVALSASADQDAGSEAAIIRLPLILSGLESAIATGRPFETELAALRRALPETLVPETLAGRAATGLPQPEAVQRRLDTALPDMLAGRPANADASWQDTAADWFRGLIAMRPAGNIEGDGPDAGIARLEAAVARRDFLAAETELSALPEPMRSAAGTVADDIASLAAAEAFLTQLRTEVLAGENGA